MNYRLFLSIIAFVLSWQGHAQSVVNTYYQTFGKGEPVLIINGGPGMNSNGFTEMAKAIAKLGYMTIIYDQRGTGRSLLTKSDDSTVTMDLMATDMENLRKELKIEKWTILGHSFGGLLACHYFASYSGHVNKLIFSSSGGVNMNFTTYLHTRIQNNLTKAQRDSFNVYQNKVAAGDTSVKTRRRRAEFLANAYVYNKTYAGLIAGRLMELNSTVNNLVINDLNNITFNYKNKFIKSRTPVLVIQGENDIISVETAEEIKNSFGHAKLKLLKECGHYGWLDKPAEYFETINLFLKDRT